MTQRRLVLVLAAAAVVSIAAVAGIVLLLAGRDAPPAAAPVAVTSAVASPTPSPTPTPFERAAACGRLITTLDKMEQVASAMRAERGYVDQTKATDVVTNLQELIDRGPADWRADLELLLQGARLMRAGTLDESSQQWAPAAVRRLQACR